MEISQERLEKMTPKERQMATGNIPKTVLAFSIPTVIGMFVQAMYVFVDRLFVGMIPDVGDDALSGLSLASPVVFIVGAFSLLIGVGAAVNISIRLGKGDREGADKVVSNALTLNLISAVVIGVLGIVFLEPLLIAFGASDATLPFADTYMRIKLYGIFFTFISFSMNHPIRAAGNAKRFASAQLLGGLLNIGLNPLFIFGFNMGIAGAAWSTVLAQSISAAWVMVYYFRGKPAIRIRPALMKLDPKIVMTIASIGIAPFLMQLLGSAVTIIANTLIRDFGGDHAIGAFGAVGAMMSLFIMPVFGITQGSNPIIGFNYGMGDMERVRKAYFSAAAYSVGVCVVGLIFIATLTDPLMWLFTSDPAVHAIGVNGIRIIVWTMPIAAFQMNAGTFFMGLGRAKISVLLSVLRQGIILIPLYFILPQFMEIDGVWMAAPAADLIAFTITILMVSRELRRLKKMGVQGPQAA
ncbi:MAG: MATE family efflux transporter [Defluviitaleaceae bacterium]|nr:MATE family efflux transporter [Defluviitaleaceae bacterium]